MKLTLSSGRFPIAPTHPSLHPQPPSPNPSFTDNYLRQQIFFKPRSDYDQQSQSSSKQLLHIQKRPTNMGNSFMSGHSSNNRLRSKQEESYKKMIIQLSHELLVKDQMIDSLRCELMGNQGEGKSQEEEEEEKQESSIRNKSSYHFKTLMEGKRVQTDMERKKSLGGLSNEQKRSLPTVPTQQKQTLSEAQFIKLYGKDSEQPVNSTSSRINNVKTHRVTQLQQKMRMKDRQLQVILAEKKMLTERNLQSQKALIAKDTQIKVLQKQLKRVDTSKDDTNHSIDNKRVHQYQQRITRLKKQTIYLSTHIEQLKKSKSNQIQSSISEWKKINQTMTDSLVKLNQENSILTKKITDLEIKLATSYAKTSELEKQNSTLKYNLENEKNSYSTLSIHYKNEKDQMGRRIGGLEREVEKGRGRETKQRVERERVEAVIKEKEEKLKILQSQLKQQIDKHQLQLTRLKQSSLESLRHQRQLKTLTQKDLQISLSSLSALQIQLIKQKQHKSSLSNQLYSSHKLISQYKSKQLEKTQQVQHYKNKVSELIQKVSEMRIEKIHGGKDKDNQREIEREETLFENQSLKWKVEELTKQMGEEMEKGEQGRYVRELQEEVRKRQRLQEINKKLGQNIRKAEQQVLSLKSRLNQPQSPSSHPSSPHSPTDSSHYHLTQQLIQHQHIIYDLRQNVRRQQDTTISLKLHLDDVNKKLAGYSQLIDLLNRLLVGKEIEMGNCMGEAEEVIRRLKEDNQELEKELKVIYERLEYFERKLGEESQEMGSRKRGRGRDRGSEDGDQDQVDQENENSYNSD